MKEIKNAPKNKWVQFFRKKWFLPAVYLILVALILTGVVWYQTTNNKWMAEMDKQTNPPSMNDSIEKEFQEDALSVVQQQEIIKMPIEDSLEAEIVTKFYDYNADESDQEKGLILYNNRYYQSTGVNIARSNGEGFDIVAALSGTVTEVKEDPLLGNIITISHQDAITTHYASLGEVFVDAGTKVKQGEKIGIAGKNLFSEESGTHLHFELSKDGKEVNPETFFNQPVSKLGDYNNDEKDAVESEKNGEEKEDKETLKELSFSFTV